MYFDSVVEKLIKGRFELKCPRMELRTFPDKKTIVFEGPGRIWFNDLGQMSFSMLDSIDKDKSGLKFQWIGKIFAFRQGRYLGAEDDIYLQLCAWDLENIQWISLYLIPHISLPQSNNFELMGEIRGLQSVIKPFISEDVHQAQFIILKPPRLPLTMSTSTNILRDGKEIRSKHETNYQKISLDSLDVEFELFRDKELLKCKVKAKEGARLVNNISVLIVEALRFMICRPVVPACYSQKHRDREVIQIEGNIRSNWKSQMYPPLMQKETEDFSNKWNIFKTYLFYLLKKANDIATYSPIGFQYFRVMEASTASLDVFMINLTVTIEGLLNICDRTKKLCSKKSIDLADNLDQYLHKWPDYERHKKRLEGWIGNLKSPSAKDILYSLLEKGIVSKREIDVWDEYRQSGAHGKSLMKEDISGIDESIAIITGLLHKIVLYEIQYQGKYTSYSEEGHPNKEFK